LATVITNLLSAIPVFGQDIVELIITKYLICFVSFSSLVKANILPVLPTVGTVSIHALKKGKKIRLEKKEYLSIPSQFIAFLTGLIDGDGYIQITKTTKGFITIKLAIQLHLDDLSTLEYIHSVLKLGKITIYRDMKSPSCKLVINRTDLQEVIFPLLLHHGIFFLTNTRRVQFDLAMYIFKFNIKIYDQITDPLLSPFLLQREEGRNLCALARLKAIGRIGRQEIKTKKLCIPLLHLRNEVLPFCSYSHSNKNKNPYRNFCLRDAKAKATETFAFQYCNAKASFALTAKAKANEREGVGEARVHRNFCLGLGQRTGNSK
jgi:LAGLIDADG endonuclease